MSERRLQSYPDLRCPVCGMSTSDPEHVAKWCEDALEGRYRLTAAGRTLAEPEATRE